MSVSRTFKMRKAVRTKTPLWIALGGPSGGGKTLSALRLATGITKVFGGKIGVIDTEAERASQSRVPGVRLEELHRRVLWIEGRGKPQAPDQGRCRDHQRDAAHQPCRAHRHQRDDGRADQRDQQQGLEHGLSARGGMAGRLGTLT